MLAAVTGPATSTSESPGEAERQSSSTV